MKAIMNFSIRIENTVIGNAKCSQSTNNLFSVEITLNKLFQVQRTKKRNVNVVSTPDLFVPSISIENVKENLIENEINSFVKKYVKNEVILEKV